MFEVCLGRGMLSCGDWQQTNKYEKEPATGIYFQIFRRIVEQLFATMVRTPQLKSSIAFHVEINPCLEMECTVLWPLCW